MKSYEYEEQFRLKKRKVKLPEVSLIIIDSGIGRIFDFKDDNLNYKKEIISSFPGRVKRGGWSQMKIERHIKDHLYWHFKKIEKEMQKDRRVKKWLILGPDIVIKLFFRKLPQNLQQITKIKNINPKNQNSETLKAAMAEAMWGE